MRNTTLLSRKKREEAARKIPNQDGIDKAVQTYLNEGGQITVIDPDGKLNHFMYVNKGGSEADDFLLG